MTSTWLLSQADGTMKMWRPPLKFYDERDILAVDRRSPTAIHSLTYKREQRAKRKLIARKASRSERSV